MDIYKLFQVIKTYVIAVFSIHLYLNTAVKNISYKRPSKESIDLNIKT